jgi:hypothetical protein
MDRLVDLETAFLGNGNPALDQIRLDEWPVVEQPLLDDQAKRDADGAAAVPVDLMAFGLGDVAKRPKKGEFVGRVLPVRADDRLDLVNGPGFSAALQRENLRRPFNPSAERIPGRPLLVNQAEAKAFKQKPEFLGRALDKKATVVVAVPFQALAAV